MCYYWLSNPQESSAAPEEGEAKPGALPSFKKSLSYKPPPPKPAITSHVRRLSKQEEDSAEERATQERLDRLSAKERKQARLAEIRKARAEAKGKGEKEEGERDEEEVHSLVPLSVRVASNVRADRIELGERARTAARVGHEEGARMEERQAARHEHRCTQVAQEAPCSALLSLVVILTLCVGRRREHLC